MLSKTGACQLCRRPGDPGHRERRQGVRQRRALHQPEDQVLRELHRRLRRRRQVQGSDAGRHRPGRRHPLPHPQPRPARHGAGGAREGHAHHRQLHRPLRHRSALRRLLDHRRRLPGRVRHRAGRWPAPGSPSSSRSAWRWARKASDMVDLQGARPSRRPSSRRSRRTCCRARSRCSTPEPRADRSCRGDAPASASAAAAVARRPRQALRQPAGAGGRQRSTSAPARSIACWARTAPASRRCAT